LPLSLVVLAQHPLGDLDIRRAKVIALLLESMRNQEAVSAAKIT
jgi:ABC-type lipoprotein export system ATPase subunit